MNRKDIVERLGRRAPGRRTSTPRSDFDLDPLGRPVETRSLRSAGVLVPLIDRPGGLTVLLTQRPAHLQQPAGPDRKSVVQGKRVSGRVDLGGGRIYTKKTKT